MFKWFCILFAEKRWEEQTVQNKGKTYSPIWREQGNFFNVLYILIHKSTPGSKLYPFLIFLNPPDWHQRQIREDSNLQLCPGPYNWPPNRHDGARHQELPAGRGSAGWDELLAAGVLQPGDAHGTAGGKQPGGLMSLALRDMDSEEMETGH